MAAGGETLIELDGVSKQFRQGNAVVQALSAVDLGIGRGEFVSIVGPSGCGKSTLLRLVAGLMPASTGRVAIGGGPPESHKNDIGIVFQAPVLLDWRDVLGNVLFPIDMRGLRVADYQERAHSLLKLVGLADFAAAHPYQLSGGMKQRCAIARALVHDPGLLLMDEPFGALDEITRDHLNDQLHKLWRRTAKTCVFVTHSIAEAVYLSTRIVVMSPRPGRILEVIDSRLPVDRHLDMRETPEFAALARRVREGLRHGHSYED